MFAPRGGPGGGGDGVRARFWPGACHAAEELPPSTGRSAIAASITEGGGADRPPPPKESASRVSASRRSPPPPHMLCRGSSAPSGARHASSAA
eukprot:971837-Prymnesium_polylepis.1